jgi:hypothetical protein
MSIAVTDHGRIKRLVLPDQWIEHSESENSTQPGSARAISEQDAADGSTASSADVATTGNTLVSTASGTRTGTTSGTATTTEGGTTSDTTSATTSATASTSHSFSLREFKPANTEDVRLCLYYRGQPISDSAGQTIQAVLGEKPHSLTTREIADLNEVLDDIAYPELFSILSIRTDDLNGKRILLVEGRWLKEQWDTYSLFISCNESGTIIQQVYFLAPVRQYANFIAMVKRCLGAIEWSG